MCGFMYLVYDSWDTGDDGASYPHAYGFSGNLTCSVSPWLRRRLVVPVSRTAATPSFARRQPRVARDQTAVDNLPSRVRCVDFAGAAGVLAYGGAGNRHIIHNPGNRPTPMSQTRGFLVELGSAVTVAIFFCLFVTRSGRGDGDAASNAAVYRLPRRESRCNGAYHALNWRIVAWCYAGWLLTPPTAGAMKVVLSILAFFFFIHYLLACDLWRS